MKSKLLNFICILLLTPFCATAEILVSREIPEKLEITSMRTNDLDHPMGIDPEDHLTFSWTLASKQTATVQTAYRIIVSTKNKQIWDSGKINTDQSIAVPYEGTLKPNTENFWTLQVWDNHGNVTKNSTENVVPSPSLLSAHTFPLCICTIYFTIASPSPAPFVFQVFAWST